MGQRELALEVLGELPDQFVDYMVMKENEGHKIYKPSDNQNPVETQYSDRHADNLVSRVASRAEEYKGTTTL